MAGRMGHWALPTGVRTRLDPAWDEMLGLGESWGNFLGEFCGGSGSEGLQFGGRSYGAELKGLGSKGAAVGTPRITVQESLEEGPIGGRASVTLAPPGADKNVGCHRVRPRGWGLGGV